MIEVYRYEKFNKKEDKIFLKYNEKNYSIHYIFNDNYKNSIENKLLQLSQNKKFEEIRNILENNNIKDTNYDITGINIITKNNIMELSFYEDLSEDIDKVDIKELDSSVKIIDINDIEIEDNICENIKIVKYKNSKVIYKHIILPCDSNDIKDEIDNYIKLNKCNNIPKFYGCIKKNDYLIGFIIEYIKGKRLETIIKDLNLKLKNNIILQILETLIFMSKFNFYHSDLKTSNILIDNNYNVRIIDLETNGFTTPYCSPEFKKTFKSNEETIVYSLGVVLWEIISGIKPEKKKDIIFDDKIPEHYKKVIKECLKLNKRPKLIYIQENILKCAQLI